MKKIITLLFLFFAFSFLTLDAQTKMRRTIRGEFQLPRATCNKAFNQIFSGVFNTGVSMNWSGKHFTVGGSYSLTQYQIFPKFFDDPHVVFTSHTPGIRISYDMLTSTGKGMFSPFISPGFSFIKYTRIKCKNHEAYRPKSNAMSVNMGVAYNIMMDEWTGAGFIFGFNMTDHVFRPENICMDEWMGFEENDKKGSLKNIFFGFSVYFDLAWKPETSD